MISYKQHMIAVKIKHALAGMIVATSLMFPSVSRAQATGEPTGLVNWMTLEDAMSKIQKVPKPILLDFYTDWCGWCKHMMKTTYSEQDLADYVNTYFYPVKFNAEGHDTITYLGKVYKPTGTGPRAPHEFAVMMLDGQLSYPSTIFLNGFETSQNNFLLRMRAPGYLDRIKIEPMLIFAVENAWRNSNFDDFSAQFDRAFRDTTTEALVQSMKWTQARDKFNGNPGNGKKSLVFINTTWCNTCRVMRRATFPDPGLRSYADTVFNFIDFDPTFAGPLTWNNQEYRNAGKPEFPFNELAKVICRNNLVIPTMVILDENDQVLDAIHFYLSPMLLKKVLYFYGQDIYKSKTWAEYAAASN